MELASVIYKNGERVLILPDSFELDCSQFRIKRIGRSVLFIPSDCDPWDLLEESLGEFTEDFMANRDQPLGQNREELFE